MNGMSICLWLELGFWIMAIQSGTKNKRPQKWNSEATLAQILASRIFFDEFLSLRRLIMRRNESKRKKFAKSKFRSKKMTGSITKKQVKKRMAKVLVFVRWFLRIIKSN